MNPCGYDFAVVMPCYNGERYLDQAIKAFFDQDYHQKKLIIVDGKSTDRSHEIIEKYISMGHAIIWDRTKDTGISNAINIGLNHVCDSDIFGYLGADDIMLPGILNSAASIFDLAPRLNGVYFDSYSYLVSSNQMQYRSCPPLDFSISALIDFGTIVGLQNIFIKAILVKEEKFSEFNKYSMDYQLYINLAEKELTKFAHIPKAGSINFMDSNVSSVFAIEGALEAVYVAISKAGYKPKLLKKLFLLKRAKFKLALIKKINFLSRAK